MHPGRNIVTAIFLGGMLGALARAGVVEALPVQAGQWPWATLSVNLAGTLILAVAVARWRLGGAQTAVRLGLVGPGFCGALTTFSTFQLELVRMLDQGHHGLALGYGAASIGGGMLAAHAGRLVGARA